MSIHSIDATRPNGIIIHSLVRYRLVGTCSLLMFVARSGTIKTQEIALCSKLLRIQRDTLPVRPILSTILSLMDNDKCAGCVTSYGTPVGTSAYRKIFFVEILQKSSSTFVKQRTVATRPWDNEDNVLCDYPSGEIDYSNEETSDHAIAMVQKLEFQRSRQKSFTHPQIVSTLTRYIPFSVSYLGSMRVRSESEFTSSSFPLDSLLPLDWNTRFDFPFLYENNSAYHYYQPCNTFGTHSVRTVKPAMASGSDNQNTLRRKICPDDVTTESLRL
ncbi:9032_t:CDS:2 [Acaulospora morrowiae]|uniref:9032_t:CDS:1 n=1 Tax=Acaulospora morrowiae TaxID=94023 RepID=A0A9N8YVL0_9GLOM|nr:9032_t:CDS:2 [Acaulospora morrowiae]